MAKITLRLDRLEAMLPFKSISQAKDAFGYASFSGFLKMPLNAAIIPVLTTSLLHDSFSLLTSEGIICISSLEHQLCAPV